MRLWKLSNVRRDHRKGDQKLSPTRFGRLHELDGPQSLRSRKQRSQWSVIRWVTKIYYLQLLRASEGTLSRWSRFYSLAPTLVSRFDVRQAAGRKNNCLIFITT
jgi:hypothetical protein